ncbi:MAG: hypothetical protein ACYC4L_10980 [Chloroflexota bacterium]
MGGIDLLELFYWIAFAFGLGYGVLGLVGGGLGGHDVAVGQDVAVGHDFAVEHEVPAGHDLAGGHDAASMSEAAGAHVSPVNSLTIAACALALGAIGLLTYRYWGLPSWLSLLVASLGGLLLAVAFFFAVLRPLMRSQSNSTPDIRAVVQSLAMVRTSIPSTGLGEIVLTSGGSRTQLPARSDNGLPLPSGTRVAIVRINRGVAEVVSMEDEALGPSTEEG